MPDLDLSFLISKLELIVLKIHPALMLQKLLTLGYF